MLALGVVHIGSAGARSQRRRARAGPVALALRAALFESFTLFAAAVDQLADGISAGGGAGALRAVASGGGAGGATPDRKLLVLLSNCAHVRGAVLPGLLTRCAAPAARRRGSSVMQCSDASWSTQATGSARPAVPRQCSFLVGAQCTVRGWLPRARCGKLLRLLSGRRGHASPRGPAAPDRLHCVLTREDSGAVLAVGQVQAVTARPPHPTQAPVPTQRPSNALAQRG